MENMEKKSSLHVFMCSNMSDELQGAEDYLRYAKVAKENNEPAISNMLLTHARQELKHYSDLKEAVESSIKDIQENPLYPLFENLEDWAEEISEHIESFQTVQQKF